VLLDVSAPISLKGQSREEVGKITLWGVSPGPNEKKLLVLKIIPIPMKCQTFNFA
jgi:hypothetical protein